MFKALKRIVLGLMLVILFAAGIYLLIPFMPSFLYEQLSEYYYYEDEQGIFIAGMLMVLLPLFYLLFSSRSRRCLLYTSPSPRDRTRSRMPSSA